MIPNATTFERYQEFKVSTIKEEVDIVISNVAFEHFDDVGKTIEDIGAVIKKGGVLYSHVDMNTHTRWIKERDPLNIYRYSEMFWNIFKFKGAPNRVRIPQYGKLLAENNWSTTIEPRTILESEYVEKIIPTLDKQFRDLDIQEMKILSFIVLSTKN